MAPLRAMNTSQAQVIDPILSTQARGYRNAEFIGARILPYLVNRGWNSAELDRMSEAEFLAVLDTQQAMDIERAEAERDAWEKARRTKGKQNR